MADPRRLAEALQDTVETVSSAFGRSAREGAAAARDGVTGHRTRSRTRSREARLHSRESNRVSEEVLFSRASEEVFFSPSGSAEEDADTSVNSDVFAPSSQLRRTPPRAAAAQLSPAAPVQTNPSPISAETLPRPRVQQGVTFFIPNTPAPSASSRASLYKRTSDASPIRADTPLGAPPDIVVTPASPARATASTSAAVSVHTNVSTTSLATATTNPVSVYTNVTTTATASAPATAVSTTTAVSVYTSVTTATVAAAAIVSTASLRISPSTASGLRTLAMYSLATDPEIHDVVQKHPAAVRQAERLRSNLFNVAKSLRDAVNHDYAVSEVAALVKTVKETRQDLKKAVSDLLLITDDPALIPDNAVRDTAVSCLETKLEEGEKEGRLVEAVGEDFLKKAESARLEERQRKMGAKLPHLPLRQFDGKGLKLSEFMESFESNVGRKPDLTDANKLEYLMSCCSGEAKDLIAQFRPSDANYKRAIKALEKRFGRSDVVVEETHAAIEALTPASRSARDSRKLLDKLKGFLTTLENHDAAIATGKSAAPLIASLKTKLNKDAIVAWLRWCGAQSWDGSRLPTMEEFLNFMDKELTTLIRSEADSTGNKNVTKSFSGDRNRPRFRPRSQTDTAAPRKSTALAVNSNPAPSAKATRQKSAAPKQRESSSAKGGCPTPKATQCLYCNGVTHASPNCPKARNFSPRERVTKLDKGCYRCLAGVHARRHCPVPKKTCNVDNCGQDHHPFLHGGLLRPT